MNAFETQITQQILDLKAIKDGLIAVNGAHDYMSNQVTLAMQNLHRLAENLGLTIDITGMQSNVVVNSVQDARNWLLAYIPVSDQNTMHFAMTKYPQSIFEAISNKHWMFTYAQAIPNAAYYN